MSETKLSADHLVLPLFVRSGRRTRRPIAAMPGVFQLSPDELLREASRAHGLGVPAVLIFGSSENLVILLECCVILIGGVLFVSAQHGVGIDETGQIIDVAIGVVSS